MFTQSDQQTVDWDMVCSRVLKHPKRSRVKPLSKHIKQVKTELAMCRTVWKSQAALDNYVKGLITISIEHAEDYLAIVACVNTVINFADSMKGPKMAQEVLDLVARRESLVVPEALKTALQQTSTGVNPLGNKGGKTGGKRAAVETESQTPQEGLIKGEPARIKRSRTMSSISTASLCKTEIEEEKSDVSAAASGPSALEAEPRLLAGLRFDPTQFKQAGSSSSSSASAEKFAALRLRPSRKAPLPLAEG